MEKTQQWQCIPTKLTLEQFEQFVLPHLSAGRRGPAAKLTFHVIFNYILYLLHTGCQWRQLPINNDPTGQPEVHYTGICRTFRRWEADGCFDSVFTGSVLKLHQTNLLDIRIAHGDGSTNAAKKGGDNIGFSGHKKVKGDKVVAFCDRNCNVLAPFVSAPGNRNESPMLLDGIYDCRSNRKAIFNRGMVPNINPNPRARKKTKRGRKPIFDSAIFKERFRTIERVFAWEDKFKRTLIRFERISKLHYALKTIAYTMINLRHFCRP